MKTKIPALRKQFRLSQEELARALGVSRQTITSIECGKYIASLPLAYKIADYFDCKIEEVFELEEYGNGGKRANIIAAADEQGTADIETPNMDVS